MRVVIVGKTRMGAGVCIGGLVEATGKAVRVIPERAPCHAARTPFNIADIWDLDLRPRRPVVPPHVEDHEFRRKYKTGTVADLKRWILSKVKPWDGGAAALFGGTLQFRATGAAFVPQAGPLPSGSTGFWRLPADMTCRVCDGTTGPRLYYELETAPRLRVKYVGVLASTELPPVLPAGTLVRLSLAHLWLSAPDADNRDKFFVQMSGWF